MVNRTRLQPHTPPAPAAPPAPDRFALALDELDANGGPLELVLRPTTALALAGLVAIGLKHPQMADAAVAPFGDAFLRAVRVYFKDSPAVLDLLKDAG
jgi:hypothetical protein